LQLNIQKVSVREVVEETTEGLRAMAEAEGLQLRFEGEEAYGLADRDRLAQVVTNLVGNAIKFTPEGGRVEVSVKSSGFRVPSSGLKAFELETRNSKLETDLGDGFVVVVVRDTGRGIPEEDLDRIFDRFYQAKGGRIQQPGVGLGLPIAKELVELMGGQIWAESEVGRGSAFWFTLPEAKEQETEYRIQNTEGKA
jgi:signal transduction histidine kinase